jgi:hypothetical protein
MISFMSAKRASVFGHAALPGASALGGRALSITR